MSVAIFSPTPYINKWQMSLCNNSSDNKSYWIHRVDVKVSAQVTTVTYMHQSQPSLHSLRKHFTVHLQLWPGNHLIWCNATYSMEGTKEMYTDSSRTARVPFYPPVQPPPPHPLLQPLPPSCPGQRNQWRHVPVAVTGVRYNSLLWMCTLNTLTWPDLTWRKCFI